MDNYLIYLLIFSLVLAIVAIGMSVFLFFKNKRLEDFFNQVFSEGNEVKDLEKTIIDLAKKGEKLDQDIEDLFDALNQINKISYRGLSQVGLVRYNPFGEKGRKDCFALALLNGKGRGVVLSSLTTETGNRIFIKEITKNGSDVPLSQEETEAVKVAN
ncbi:MAG: DUF4446 family protein [Candidatus Moranbacteria bacterium]|nr:DUF4446 family protein [Candidatus Moranbacteria bacterium]